VIVRSAEHFIEIVITNAHLAAPEPLEDGSGSEDSYGAWFGERASVPGIRRSLLHVRD
jgi:hypothetical protein